jgi:nitroreductase
MTIPNKPADTSAHLADVIKNRWSPRIFDSSHALTQDQIKSLGEAVRWAPSSSNQQPWHVVFLTQGSELFREISDKGLTGFNQAWAPSCSIYAVMLARQTEKGKSRDQAGTYFDVGLASMQLVIQAETMGLKSHFMGGIVQEEIQKTLKVQDHWVVCVIAIGKQASIATASEDLIARETAERTRLPATDVYSINQPLS